MKIKTLIAGATFMVALAGAAHASGNINDHLAAFQTGVHGVYNRSAIADVGNPDARYPLADHAPTKMDMEECIKMPCCKHMKMSKDECMKMMQKGQHS